MSSFPPMRIKASVPTAPRPVCWAGLTASLWPAFLVALLAMFAAGGCDPHVSLVRAEADAQPEGFEPAEFVIVSGQKDEDTASHAYRRNSQALAAELVRLSFTRARTPETAQVFVILRFGLVGEEVPHQGTGLEHLFVLDIEAVDATAARSKRETPPLWKVTATAHGHLDQRETVFKSLLAVCAPLIGQRGDTDLRVHRDPATGTYEFIPR